LGLLVCEEIAVVGGWLAMFDADGEEVGVDSGGPEGVSARLRATVAPGGVFDEAALDDDAIAPDDELGSGFDGAGLEVAGNLFGGAGHAGAWHDEVLERVPIAAPRAIWIAVFVMGHPDGGRVLCGHGNLMWVERKRTLL